MYELIQVGENTYYIEGPTKIGIYHLGNGEVCLIDRQRQWERHGKAHSQNPE